LCRYSVKLTVTLSVVKTLRGDFNAAGRRLLQKRGELAVSLSVEQSSRSIHSKKLTFKKPGPRSAGRERRLRLS
jgi:hypothetical protein